MADHQQYPPRPPQRPKTPPPSSPEHYQQYPPRPGGQSSPPPDDQRQQPAPARKQPVAQAPKSSVAHVLAQSPPPRFSDPDRADRSGQKKLDFGVDFTPVSSKLITVRYIHSIFSLLIGLAITVTIAVVATFVLAEFEDVGSWSALFWILPAGVLICYLVKFFLIPRQVRAIGYAEREDDVVTKRGLWIRRVMAVPYGRLQYVDINSGPLQRHFNICDLTLTTAASTSVLEGVPLEEAERLREELTARGQARLAGL
ncbi:PH domain-containing protein [Auritidibacter ignavus]|uniref:PH domain-containing protein n=1 Tax=Auritidibacter ignavus TaxID=678932 RepID=UPI000D731D2D|nr:PH domain-containing protein [Auritidibacter ignavus]PXA78575.1 hypothetical protein DCC26_07120 [Auritidibacter sp. NML120779]WGH80860.1 PH domain-containing protein [Auritidibacter ignavus]